MRAGYKQTEVGVIPKDWELEYVEDLAHITTGGRNTQDRLDEGQYPFFVRSQTIERISTYSFDGEAVLTAGDGVGTGKVFHYINGKFDAHQRVYRISDFNERISGYFFFLYFSNHFFARIMQMTAKSSVDSVRRDMIARMRIPLPPTKAEQEAIAGALGDADALIESLERLLAKKRQLKQGAMQELLTGKRRLPGFEVKPGYKQTGVGEIPEDWDSKTVNEIASPIRNAIVGGPFGSDLVSADYVDHGVPVIRGQNMGSRSISGSFAFVTEAKARSLESNLARPRDLLFTQRGTLGQVSVVPDQPYDRYLVSQSQMKLTVDRGTADPLFLYFVFSSANHQEIIRQNTIQTGVPHINLGILRSLPVQQPSLVEQEAIAVVFSDMDEAINALEAKLSKARNIKQGMMQELLTGRIRLV